MKWLFLVSSYGCKLKQPGISIIFQGEEYYFDQKPYLKNNQVMLPVKGVVSLLAAPVEWVEDMVYLTQGDDSICLNVAHGTALINDEAVSLDVPAEIKDGWKMVSLRLIAEDLPC